MGDYCQAVSAKTMVEARAQHARSRARCCTPGCAVVSPHLQQCGEAWCRHFSCAEHLKAGVDGWLLCPCCAQPYHPPARPICCVQPCAMVQQMVAPCANIHCDHHVCTRHVARTKGGQTVCPCCLGSAQDKETAAELSKVGKWDTSIEVETSASERIRNEIGIGNERNETPQLAEVICP